MAVNLVTENMRARLARIRANNTLQVVDLFSGCGGMSLGLQRAGYHVLGGIEINSQAIATYAKNLFRGASETERALHATAHDITEFSPEQFMREVLHEENPEGLVDVIAGGPPCQAFSRIGRAKLRAVRKHPEAFRVDERSNLYIKYLDYVEFFRPLAVIMENVTDIMNHGGKNVAGEIAASLEDLGYCCKYTILNTVHYGIPQFRQRFYLIALLANLPIEPDFPMPTHTLKEKIPPGYESARYVALKILKQERAALAQQKLFSAEQDQEVVVPKVHYVQTPEPVGDLKEAVTVRAALADLPPLRAHFRANVRSGARHFTELMHYIDAPPSEYAREMREWDGFSSNDGVVDHVIRYLPRDYPIFRMMKCDDQYPQAYQIAQALFQRRLVTRRQRQGIALEKGSEEYKKLLKETVPPYDPEKFPNKWWKLNPDRPSRTLTAHMGKDTYSHIHYDHYQGRVISVREAARLQSFPDGFQFAGAMNAAYTQIGNAVAPKQAFVLGEHVKHLLQKAAERMCGPYELVLCGNEMQMQEMSGVEAKG